MKADKQLSPEMSWTGWTNENTMQNIDRTQPRPQHWDSFLSKDIPCPTKEEILTLPAPDYLAHINHLAFDVVHSEDYLDPETGYISAKAWKRLVDGGLLAATLIDRDINTQQEEIMQTCRILSYYDINLGLSYGITTGLAARPLQQFGTPEQQEKYLGKIREGEMFGLAITEEHKSGSSTMISDSVYEKNEETGNVNLSFAKRHQGLSGNGGLIISANKANSKETTTGLFIVDQDQIQTETTETEGLNGIHYGKNRGDIVVNQKESLMSEIPWRETGKFVRMFVTSRLLFVGMTLGHLERTEYEANKFASQRVIGVKLQENIPVAKDVLDEIRADRIASEALHNRVLRYREGENSLLNSELSNYRDESGIVKALSTDYAFESALQRADLRGGEGFDKGSALHDAVNIWPFTIFEGTRLMLYSQIGKAYHHTPLFTDTQDGKLFDRFTAGENMDYVTKQLLESPDLRVKSEVVQELLGEIASRCFALGCVQQDQLQPQDYALVVNKLNLEIQNLAWKALAKSQEDGKVTPKQLRGLMGPMPDPDSKTENEA